MTWQPIETAPKDRTSVIVCEDQAVGEAYYDDEKGSWWWANTGPHDFDACSQIFPTLWQPLPAPPVNGDRG